MQYNHGTSQMNSPNLAQYVEPPRAIRELLAEAGIRINGDASWDMRVLDDTVYRRVLVHGSLGLGEAYMDGLWEADRLDEFFHRLLRYDLNEKVGGWRRWRLIGAVLRHLLLNPQSPLRAFQVGEQHYDIGNDVFQAMLDPTMSYSCAYWADADNLADAQRHKLELICRKLELRPGERLLDIGCGWGGLAHHAATHHGVEVVSSRGDVARVCRFALNFRTIVRSKARSTRSSRSACSNMSARKIIRSTLKPSAACWPTRACFSCTPSAITRPPVPPNRGSRNTSSRTASCPRPGN